MTTDWVIGRGLLGNAVAGRLRKEPYRCVVRWGSTAQAAADLARGLDEVYAREDHCYTIYWCAGSGVTSTSASAVAKERELFELFLADLASRDETRVRNTVVFLASSVGGAYAGSHSPPYSEFSPPVAASPYGLAKLGMEAALAETASVSGLRGLIGRITNLYGPGQKLGKQQGLISVICQTYASRVPATVYVSLDTLRNYIYEEDCARVIVAGVQRLHRLPQGQIITKIIGASGAVSIGELIGTISRVARKRPLVAFAAADARGQAPDLRVRSVVWPDLDALVETALPTGIARVLESIRQPAQSTTRRTDNG